MSMTSLTSDQRTTCRASSVLDRNKQLYGASNMLSADLSTCWNSAQGSPQRVHLQFHRVVDVTTLSVMFQGGFVGQDVRVDVKRPGGDGQWEQVEVDIDPADCNDLQEFPCSIERVEALAITFQRSTDFYGRVVIYRLDVQGSETSLQ